MTRGEGAAELAERGSTEELAMGGDDYVFRHSLQRELECETFYD